MANMLAQSGAWPLLLSCRPEQTWTPSGFVRVEDRETEGGVLAALADVWSAAEAEVLSVHATKPVCQLRIVISRDGAETVLEGEAWCYTFSREQ